MIVLNVIKNGPKTTNGGGSSGASDCRSVCMSAISLSFYCSFVRLHIAEMCEGACARKLASAISLQFGSVSSTWWTMCVLHTRALVGYARGVSSARSELSEGWSMAGDGHKLAHNQPFHVFEEAHNQYPMVCVGVRVVVLKQKIFHGVVLIIKIQIQIQLHIQIQAFTFYMLWLVVGFVYSDGAGRDEPVAPLGRTLLYLLSSLQDCSVSSQKTEMMPLRQASLDVVFISRVRC